MQFHMLIFIASLFSLHRLLTESKQAEFIHKARILIQLEKYEDAVSIKETTVLPYTAVILLSVQAPNSFTVICLRRFDGLSWWIYSCSLHTYTYRSWSHVKMSW